MSAINLVVEGVEVVVEGVLGVNGLGFVGQAGAQAAAEVAVAEWAERVAVLRFAALLWMVEVVVEDFEGGRLGSLRLVPGPWDHFYEVFEHIAPAIVVEEEDERLVQQLLGLSWQSVETSVEEVEAELASGWDGEPVLSEYEQGWANIRAEERAAVARQVAEDAAKGRAVYYQGVRGSLEPDGGYIFEP